MKRSSTLYWSLLGLMFIVVAGLIGFSVLLFFQGPVSPSSLLNNDVEPMNVYVQAPPASKVGDEIKMVVTVENAGDQFRQVDEIRLPDRLMEVAVVKKIFPALTSSSVAQQFYGDQTGFRIGLMLQPGESKSFEITLMPWQIADVTGDLEIVSGDQHIPASFRLAFDKAVAVLPPTVTPMSPTQEPTSSPVPVIPTATPPVIPYNSVVRIIAKVKWGPWLKPVWSGSGTIVSKDGLILTNAHLVNPSPFDKYDYMVIALTVDPVAEPVEKYMAQPIVTDPKLDIAILQINTDLKYNPVDLSKLDLPVMPLGDSDSLQLGDPISILGYPGIGGNTITLTSGNVGGFTEQSQYGLRAFIKTAASISGGTSGGMVMDKNGKLVAIPTQLGSGGDDALVDCRVIQDTNGDGKINAKDQCIPVGGFINALRPVNLAIPLIEEARRITGHVDGSQALPSPSPTP
jgi:S1-C subfamily serine protease